MQTTKCGIFILNLQKFLGTPYRLGAEARLTLDNAGKIHILVAENREVDCSELMQIGLWSVPVTSVSGIAVTRWDGAGNQYLSCRPISVGAAGDTPGALLFREDAEAYRTKPAHIGHVGAVIGPGYVLHASSSKGEVVITPITSWWNRAGKIPELYEQ